MKTQTKTKETVAKQKAPKSFIYQVGYPPIREDQSVYSWMMEHTPDVFNKPSKDLEGSWMQDMYAI